MQEGDGRSATWTEHGQSTLQATWDTCIDTLPPPFYQQAHPGTLNPSSTGPPSARTSSGAGSFINKNFDLPQVAGGLSHGGLGQVWK